MKSEFVRYSRKSEIKERRPKPKELRKLISLGLILGAFLPDLLMYLLLLLLQAHASCVRGLAISGEIVGDQSIQPPVPATTPTLGSATWFNYQRNLPTSCLQAKETLSEISGTDDIFGIQIEPGDTNFLLELRDLKNAEVTESSPVQSVQGRINARKNW